MIKVLENLAIKLGEWATRRQMKAFNRRKPKLFRSFDLLAPRIKIIASNIGATMIFRDNDGDGYADTAVFLREVGEITAVDLYPHFLKDDYATIDKRILSAFADPKATVQ